MHCKAPSKHSGLNSLQPNEPNNSLMTISAFCSGLNLRMSVKTISTSLFQMVAFFDRNLKKKNKIKNYFKNNFRKLLTSIERTDSFR